MAGSPVFSINFTNRLIPAKPKYLMSIENSQAILKYFIDLKSETSVRISEYTQRERKCSFRRLQIFISQTTDSHFANYRFSFRKLQIPISQTTDSHFANYRFSFRKLQILISQTTDSHFANYRFPFRKVQISISQTTDFHFVSSHFVSQTTVSHLWQVTHCKSLEDNLEEMIKLMHFSARAKTKRFHRKSLVEFQILLLISDCHIGVLRRNTSMASPYKAQ